MQPALQTPPPEVETLIPLSRAEARRLEECEKVIERGLDTFYDVGNALTEIRDSRLYRMTFPTFEDYCREKWDMSKTHANRFISAAAVVDNLTPIGVTPANEAQARELASLDPRAQQAVWQIALNTAVRTDEGKPMVTAGHINSVVKTISDIIDAGGADDGSGEMKPLGVLITAAVTEETYERMQRQKEYIKEEVEEKFKRDEHKARFKSDRSEVEVVYQESVQADLARYIATVTEFEENQWPGELAYFARIFQIHKTHAHFQKTRNVHEDCEQIMTVVKRLCPDTAAGFEIGAQELYDWVFDLGFCMSKKEFTARLTHMSLPEIRMLLFTDAGDGKQDGRRGALPGIVTTPWTLKREREKEDKKKLSKEEQDWDF